MAKERTIGIKLRKVNIIFLIILGVIEISLFTMVLIMYLESMQGISINIILVSFILVVICIAGFTYALYSAIRRDLNEVNAEKEVSNMLSTDYFKEVCFIPTCKSIETDIMENIVNNISCRFYAKFTKNHEVIIFANDSKGNKISKEMAISNMIYFKDRFKLKEE